MVGGRVGMEMRVWGMSDSVCVVVSAEAAPHRQYRTGIVLTGVQNWCIIDLYSKCRARRDAGEKKALRAKEKAHKGTHIRWAYFNGYFYSFA